MRFGRFIAFYFAALLLNMILFINLFLLAIVPEIAGITRRLFRFFFLPGVRFSELLGGERAEDIGILPSLGQLLVGFAFDALLWVLAGAAIYYANRWLRHRVRADT
jgi:hypothetical protein